MSPSGSSEMGFWNLGKTSVDSLFTVYNPPIGDLYFCDKFRDCWILQGLGQTLSMSNHRILGSPKAKNKLDWIDLNSGKGLEVLFNCLKLGIMMLSG